tara:strand:+ start:6811 stop:7854 length:1044 start_codon:yes stop_codon:yes gene_type:complete
MAKRVLTIVGARPQFIKAAAFSREASKDSRIDETLVHTGQHFDENMSKVFFKELDIPNPKYSLNINGGSHGKMTGKMLSALEDVLTEEEPDIVLVYGDTNSTLAGSIAAAKLNIPIAHVEAGLRSFNKRMPEEINRVLTDHVSDFLFCPTKESVKNLRNEGISNGIFHVGDVMYDATLHAKEFLVKEEKKYQKTLRLRSGEFALMTIHRQESSSAHRFSKIMQFAIDFAEEHNLGILFPVHPRIRRLVDPYREESRFRFLEPLSYIETQYTISKAHTVLTDSGGLQKEAYFHSVPCVTLRSETEWVETIECGWNRLWTVENYNARNPIDEYGNGTGAKKILNTLMNA